MCKSFRPAKLPTLATDSDRFSQTRRGILNLCFICGEFSAALLRGPGGRFRFLLWSYADLFQERLDRLFPPEELLDGDVHIARIAWLVNFVTQSQTSLLVKVTILRFLKDGGHIARYRVLPGIAVIPGIVSIQVTKVGNERRAGINWQKNLFQNRIRNRHAIVRVIFRVLIVQRDIERRECELASVENTGISELGIIHFFNV